jgi:hypothetical protein
VQSPQDERREYGEVVLMPVPRDGSRIVEGGVTWVWSEALGSWVYVCDEDPNGIIKSRE